MINLGKNLLRIIKRNIFPFYKDKELKIIFKSLQKGLPKEKVAARYVGGCVRKYLLGERIDDIDIATILTVDQVKERLSSLNLKIIDTGIKHGTVTIISKNYKLEITTLRQDVVTDGRHAEVEYTDNWQLDSERRDFTINAIYLDTWGKIFDPQMGTIDLKNNNVKFIGDPQKRIEEDYLRIIRFLRFKIMYDLKIENTTTNVIKQNLDGIQKISKERILLELFKILDLKNFLIINENSQIREIFNMIFPEFLYFSRLNRLKEISEHFKFNKDILLAVLLIDEKANQEYFSHKYRVSNELKKTLVKLASNMIVLKKDKNFLKRDLTKNLYLNGRDHLTALAILFYVINPKLKLNIFLKILNKISKSMIPKFHITGEYLKQNGMKEGELIGEVLRILEKEWINNSFEISKERIDELIKIYSN
tara:strand:+ start:54 stop:1316 length:1263 start_codon:yes stop_codon:yes gene_type:complete